MQAKEKAIRYIVSDYSNNYINWIILIKLPIKLNHVCTLVEESTDAPLCSSSSTNSLCPSLAARCNALRPF